MHMAAMLIQKTETFYPQPFVLGHNQSVWAVWSVYDHAVNISPSSSFKYNG